MNGNLNKMKHVFVYCKFFLEDEKNKLCFLKVHAINDGSERIQMRWRWESRCKTRRRIKINFMARYIEKRGKYLTYDWVEDTRRWAIRRSTANGRGNTSLIGLLNVCPPASTIIRTGETAAKFPSISIISFESITCI